MREHDHDMIAEDRPSPERCEYEEIIYEKNYRRHKLTIKMVGTVEEYRGENFALECWEYSTQDRIAGRGWTEPYAYEDLASALSECGGDELGTCPQWLAEEQASIWSHVAKALNPGTVRLEKIA